MPYQILVDTQLPAEIQALLANDCMLHAWPSSNDDPILRSIEGIFTYGHPAVGDALLDHMPKLKVISNFGVGVDHIDLAAARRHGIPVGNTPNILDGATADLTFALLLAIARDLIVGNRYARSPEFVHYDPSWRIGSEVHHATLGIIGMGNIGRQVARRARGFDMTVLYHNRNRNPQAEAELGVSYASLPELLQRADYVALNLPLSDATRGMIGRAELNLMKSTAFLINVARGGVIDHDALTEALINRSIAGAALDVTEPEPLPRDHPLLKLDNVVIVPHLGSATRQTRQAMAQLSIDNLRAGLVGADLPSRIA